MRKTKLILILLILGKLSIAQGLENVLVETYYISDANDATVNSVGGVLPVGSVTYRIYLDMLPGYRFQAVYGVPGHECRIETSTLFFNNEDRGATSPTYTKNHAEDNTVMLDSWLSAGAACTNNFGILKSLDDGIATVVNSDGVLINADPLLGIPLNVQDGLMAGTPEPVTFVGITNEILVFDNQNDGTNGPLFTTENGSWAALNGAIGPDSMDNKVLVAQITTDGVFSFKLNVQIGTPSGGVENYVAENPVGSEILFPALTYPVPVNVSNSNRELVFSIHPNPATDLIRIKNNGLLGEIKGCNIYDLTGSLIVQDISYNSAGIDISSFTPGMYIMEVKTSNASSFSSFVKF